MRKNKFFAAVLSIMMILSLIPTTAMANEPEDETVPQEDETVYVAQIGQTKYRTLGDAVAAVPENGAATTITLLASAEGGGVKVSAGKNIIFDLGGYTYTIGVPTVGSVGTETNGFQLLKDSTVTMRNGTIKASNYQDLKIMIQNYCDLTLEDVTLDAREAPQCSYVASNNFGNVVITGNTCIYAAENQCAFDLYYWPSHGSGIYSEGITVTVDTTGTIQGKIEYGSDGTSAGKEDIAKKAKLSIQGGTIDGEISPYGLGTGADTGIVITGGTFTGTDAEKASFASYVVDGMKMDASGAVVIDNETAKAEMNGIGYTSLQAAIDAAGNGDIVKMVNDANENITVSENQKITLDLNGCTLTNDTATGTTHTITNKGDLTIIDSDSANGGTVDNVSHARGALVNNKGATAVLKGGTFTRSAEASTSASNSGGNSWYVLDNAGTMTIDGATVFNKGYFSSLIRNKGTADKVAELTIASGTVQQDNFIAVKNDDYSKLYVTGGHIISGEQTIQNWTTAEVSGGVLDGKVITWSYEGNPSTTTISDSAVINGDVVAVNYDNKAEIPTVNIQGGTVNGELEKGLYENGVGIKAQEPGVTTSDINVSGGAFQEVVNENFCADGYVPVTTKNDDGMYAVTKETETGTTVTGLTLSQSAMTLTVGDTATLTATVTTTPEFGTAAATWSSSNPAIATVSNGRVTAVKAGTVKITVKAGDLTRTCTVTVKAVSSTGTSSRDDDDGYSVSVPGSSSIKNGSITVSPRSAEKGDTVTITVKPDAGYELDTLTVTDSSGKTVKLTEKRDNQYTFTMPASAVRVQVSFTRSSSAAERRFTDVSDSYWAESEIAWAAENGYMNGNTATTFNPEGTVTRQQLWMILARLSGYEPADFTEAKAWAVDNAISDGTNPGGAVSRQQLVTILYRYAARMGYKTTGAADLTAYPDHGSVASYAGDAMGWSVANSIVGGTAQGTLNPAGTATRAQFAVILYRFCDKVVG